MQRQRQRGRPIGSMPGDPRRGGRLSVIDTLRAAVPWQRLRARESSSRDKPIDIRKEDFRLIRFQHRSESTTVFVVDASGSAALHRLAEAKGAVELLLADCYVRRDEVALIAFRGEQAELLLPPTRSLLRAKRSLSGLPGGGGTPLASAIAMAEEVARQILRRGASVGLVFLTDGVANIARDGQRGREHATEDAFIAARSLRDTAARCLVIDTSPRAQTRARQLAEQLDAVYLAMPHADAGRLKTAVDHAGVTGAS
jgi:magnesium chelatase subunit D